VPGAVLLVGHGVEWAVTALVRVARVQWFFTCLLVLATAVLLWFPGCAVYRRYPGVR
jgi:hypothetical protein